MSLSSRRTLVIAVWLFCNYNSLARCEKPLDDTIQYVVCNLDVALYGTQYIDNIGSAIGMVWDNIAYNGFDYYTTSNGSSDVCYAHGACNGKLLDVGCTRCIVDAENAIRQTCGTSGGGLSVGAQAQLADCRLRYEKNSFAE